MRQSDDFSISCFLLVTSGRFWAILEKKNFWIFVKFLSVDNNSARLHATIRKTARIMPWSRSHFLYGFCLQTWKTWTALKLIYATEWLKKATLWQWQTFQYLICMICSLRASKPLFHFFDNRQAHVNLSSF